VVAFLALIFLILGCAFRTNQSFGWDVFGKYHSTHQTNAVKPHK